MATKMQNEETKIKMENFSFSDNKIVGLFPTGSEPPAYCLSNVPSVEDAMVCQ